MLHCNKPFLQISNGHQGEQNIWGVGTGTIITLLAFTVKTLIKNNFAMIVECFAPFLPS